MSIRRKRQSQVRRCDLVNCGANLECNLHFFRLHFCRMGQTITFRLTKKLAGWIEQTAARIGVSQGKLIRDHLERARQNDNGARKFMRFAGVIRRGPRNLSTRKGFSKK